MKKKYLSFLVVTAILVSSTFFYKPTAASSTGFEQGNQYMQGLYDLQGDAPTPFNWNRNSQFYSVESNPKIKWIQSFGPQFKGNPTLDGNGTIYTSTQDGYINAFNINDGSLKWRYYIHYSSRGLAPVIGKDGVLYTGNHAINLDGTSKWVAKINYNTAQKTVALDDKGNIYLSAYGNLFSFDANGNINWEYKVTDGAKSEISAPTIGSDGTIYIAKSPTTPGIVAINPDGTEKWTLDVKNSNAFKTDFNSFGSIAIGKDGTLYFALTLNTFYAVNPDGTIKWKYEYPAANDITSGPAVGADGSIYFSTRDKYLNALNEDGTLKWKYLNKGIPTSIPIMDKKGTLYYGGGSNNVVALTPNGELLWDFNIGGRVDDASLTIGSDGTLYAANGANLTAITGDVFEEINYCERYSTLESLTEEDLNSQEAIDKAKMDLQSLKDALNELENKINQAESNL